VTNIYRWTTSLTARTVAGLVSRNHFLTITGFDMGRYSKHPGLRRGVLVKDRILLASRAD
jgi:hypothetical protein